MILKHSVLTESLSLRTITTDKFKTGTLSLALRFQNEPKISPYMLLLGGLLTNCTQSYPTKAAFARRLDELYSTSIAPYSSLRGKNRLFFLTAEMLDNAYATDDVDIADSVCGIMSDVLLRPLLDADGLLPEKAFEQEKRRVISYLRSTVNNPARYALVRLDDLTMRNDPAHLDLEGKIKVLEDCDRAALTEFYKNNVANRKIDAFYIGSLSHEQMAERLTRHLGTHVATAHDAPSPLAPRYPLRETAYLDEEMPINQGRLAIALRTGVCASDEEHFAIILANEIFGGSAASKLFLNVRERLSLCYSCYSSYDAGSGEMTISCGIDPANRELAQKAILAELEDVKLGNVSDKEFSAAKLALENSYKEIYDNPYGIISFYAKRIPLGIDLTIDECRERISALTLKDVVRAANKINVDSVYFLFGSGGENEEDYDE